MERGWGWVWRSWQKGEEVISVEEAGCVEVGCVGVVDLLGIVGFVWGIGFVLEMDDLMVVLMQIIDDGLHENMQFWNEIE